MKKVCSLALSFCLLLGLLFFPEMEASAANVSLGVSASTINIGDTVTVTVSVPENISATVDLSFSSSILSFVSASADVGTNGSTITMNIGKYSLAATTSVSVTFKATTSGSASVSASVVSAVDNDTAEEVSLGGASTSITVQNQTPDTPDEPDDPVDPVEPDDPPLSADNSLSSLKLSSGTLSPSFQYSVTSYTATVGYDVTSVVVSAKTSNEKATIESVTGNGTVSLSVGENVIKIVVKAENGVKATYTITVTRQAQSSEPTDPEDSESETTESENTETESTLEWNGQVLQPAEEVPDEVVPADFEVTSLVINNVETPCLTFANGDLKVLYLVNAEGAEGLYVYDEAQQIVYPFVKLASEKNYVMVLLPDAANAPAPEHYSACTLSVEGKGIINAYQFVQPATTTETTGWFGAETFYAAEPVATDFYLIYCMNNAGEKGWYVYDSVEGTFQRYLGSVHTPVDGGTEGATPIVPGEDANALAQELENAKKTQLLIICVSAFVIIVLIIVIVNLALKNRSDEEDDFDDEEDDDEYYDDEEYEFEEDVDTTDDVEDLNENDLSEEDEIEIEFYEMTKESATEDETAEITELVVDEADDEIEIEFYEMTEDLEETELSEEADDDDEVEVEFYNMEDLLLKEAIAEEQASESAVLEETSTKKEAIPEKKNPVASKSVVEENIYTDDDDDDDDLEFIELD